VQKPCHLELVIIYVLPVLRGARHDDGANTHPHESEEGANASVRDNHVGGSALLVKFICIHYGGDVAGQILTSSGTDLPHDVVLGAPDLKHSVDQSVESVGLDCPKGHEDLATQRAATLQFRIDGLIIIE
jgi:hypothetical protein